MKIAIVGAGIMGRLLAWRLCQQGHRLTIFDRDPIESGTAAAYTAAGMLTPYTEVESAELTIYQMGMQSLQLWPILSAELGHGLGFQRRGSLILAHAGDRADQQRFRQQVQYKLQPDVDQFQHLSSDQLGELEPELAGRFNDAVYLPEEAWVNSDKTMAALAASLLAKGVNWRPNTVVRKTAPHCLWAEGEKYSFDWVIDCRGLGAKPEWSSLRGVRGEVVRLKAPDVNITRLVRLMHPRYRLYVVPRPNSIYIIGATQIESDDMGPITVRSSLELLSALYSLHPGFSEAAILSTGVNCRPALIDNLPAIRYDEGLIRVNGLFRHGYLLAPVLAGEVASWLEADGDYQSSYEGLIQQGEAIKEVMM